MFVFHVHVRQGLHRRCDGAPSVRVHGDPYGHGSRAASVRVRARAARRGPHRSSALPPPAAPRPARRGTDCRQPGPVPWLTVAGRAQQPPRDCRGSHAGAAECGRPGVATVVSAAPVAPSASGLAAGADASAATRRRAARPSSRLDAWRADPSAAEVAGPRTGAGPRPVAGSAVGHACSPAAACRSGQIGPDARAQPRPWDSLSTLDTACRGSA